MSSHLQAKKIIASSSWFTSQTSPSLKLFLFPRGNKTCIASAGSWFSLQRQRTSCSSQTGTTIIGCFYFILLIFFLKCRGEDGAGSLLSTTMTTATTAWWLGSAALPAAATGAMRLEKIIWRYMCFDCRFWQPNFPQKIVQMRIDRKLILHQHCPCTWRLFACYFVAFEKGSK